MRKSTCEQTPKVFLPATEQRPTFAGTQLAPGGAGNNSLTVLCKAKQMLDEASTIQEVRELRAKFLAMGEWVKQMKLGREHELAAMRYALRAEAKMGEMLAQTPKATGGEYGGKPKIDGSRSLPSNPAPTLADMGITKNQSSKAQRIADIPERKREELIAQVESREELLRVGLGAHVSKNTGDNEWYTPTEYIEAARAVMGGIDLDPASTEEANAVVKAKKFYTVEDDGLQQKWSGRVWMNPPYAATLIGPFCDQLVDSFQSGAVSEFIVLVNNATETKWFQALAAASRCLCLPAGRIKFWHPRKAEAAAPLQGQAILYGGEHADSFSKAFKDFGIVWKR